MRSIKSTIVKLHIPQIAEEIVEVGLAPQARVQRIDEEIVEVLIPQIMEAIVEEFQIAPQVQFFGEDVRTERGHLPSTN